MIMDDLISKLSEIRSGYNCFDESEEPQYRALSEAIKILSNRADGDTISRQAAIEAMRCMQTYKLFDGDEMLLIDKAEAMTELMMLPSAQPDIIRCKDCKHQVKEWRTDKRLKDGGYTVCGCGVVGDACGYWALLGQDDDYCSMAERGTDGSDR